MSAGNGNRIAVVVGAVVGVLALLFTAGIFPLQHKVEGLEERERISAEKIAHLFERFEKTEADFEALHTLTDTRLRSNDDAILVIQDWLKWWAKIVPGLDSEQNMRLRALEREHGWPPLPPRP